MTIKKKKILHTMTRWVKGSGVDHNLLINLKEQVKHYEVHLAVGSTIEHNDFHQIEGLTVHRCPYLTPTIKLAHDLLSVLWFYKLIRSHSFEIVHTHETKASLITRIAAWAAKSPHIVYGLHGVTFNDPLSVFRRHLYLWIERLTIWMNHVIVPVGKEVIQIYHNHSVAKKIPYQVIYSGIDTKYYKDIFENKSTFRREIRTQLNLDPQDFVFINIGRFSSSKNQKDCIYAFKEGLKQATNFKIIFLGNGPQLEPCRILSKDLGLSKNVLFYGHTDQVSQFLAAADVLVMTSLREGLPRVAVEASLMGVPTIAYPVEGIAEVIENESQGIVIASRCVSLLREKMLFLASNPKQASQMGLTAQGKVIKQWDANKMVSDTLHLYQELLGGVNCV
jgi:glycosyltransferase involved in cell wall biosynthesis